MKKIAVLMSTYNGEKYLREQLDSIINQTISDDIQIIVRDDGSTDRTLDILREYQDAGYINFYNGENMGCVMSFFKLLNDAPDVEYYVFADQDDFWLPEKLEVGIKAIKDIDGPALYCSKKIIVDENLKDLYREDAQPSFKWIDVLSKQNLASGCTMVFNNKLRKKFHFEETNNNLYHDTCMFVLAYFYGKIIYDQNSYILYRQHGNNVVGAIPVEKPSLVQKLSNADWSFDKYRQRNKAKYYSDYILKYKDKDLSQKNYEHIFNISHARESWVCRVKLLFSGGLSKKPFYEYLVYKMFIILGWI